MKQALDLDGICSRMLPGNSCTRELAGQFMQIQCYRQPLLAGHVAIKFDLLLRRCCRSHDESMTDPLRSSMMLRSHKTILGWPSRPRFVRLLVFSLSLFGHAKELYGADRGGVSGLDAELFEHTKDMLFYCIA